MSKNNPSANWRPSASLDSLRRRASIIQAIRQFFIERGLLEVDTPLMCHTSVTDPYIQSVPALFQALHSREEQRHYLQTSPEYAMKRLLAAGSGSIFQITKAFRQGEIGRWHNPEFTMLEWYRVGYDHHQLMDEMDELLQHILKEPRATRSTYQALFQTHLGIDPHTAKIDQLITCAKQHHLDIASSLTSKDDWLNLLLSHCIEPKLGREAPCFIYDFPASQAALARIIPGTPPLAARFEVYYQGIELANGFYELQQSQEQKARFEANLKARQLLDLPGLPIDNYFLAALDHGLPDCAGVALGVDRLVMLATQKSCLQEVLSFDFERA